MYTDSMRHCIRSFCRTVLKRIFAMTEPEAEYRGIKRKLDSVDSQDTIKPCLNTEEATTSAQKSESGERPTRKPKARKFAMLISYSGVGYYGMQINGDFPTVEKDLFQAFRAANLIEIPEECEKIQPGSFKFQRAARTDKGVSAIHQICSIALRIYDQELIDLPKKINEHLPSGVRVMGFKRATKGFDSKRASSARTYAYTLPTFAFAHADEKTDESFRMGEDRLLEVNDILKIYRGTHNYFNFTSGREHSNPSCNRYIISCECGEPFLHSNLEFATIHFKGQSFVLHQIRKMVEAFIRFNRPCVVIPDARTSLKNDGRHQKNANAEKIAEEVEKHKNEWIFPKIFEGEIKDKSMFNWLSTLPLHVYERSDNVDNDSSNGRKSPLAEAFRAVKYEETEPRTAESQES